MNEKKRTQANMSRGFQMKNLWRPFMLAVLLMLKKVLTLINVVIAMIIGYTETILIPVCVYH